MRIFACVMIVGALAAGCRWLARPQVTPIVDSGTIRPGEAWQFGPLRITSAELFDYEVQFVAGADWSTLHITLPGVRP